MQRNLDLAREILLFFEIKDNIKYVKDLEIEGYEKNLVSYHVDMLYEAGYLNGEPTYSQGGRLYDVLPFRLTWEGHEFLDNIREEKRWIKMKQKIAEKGGVFSFELIKKLAIKFASEQLFG